MYGKSPVFMYGRLPYIIIKERKSMKEKRIEVRLSEQEHESVRLLAQHSKLKMSDYVRTTILGNQITTTDIHVVDDEKRIQTEKENIQMKQSLEEKNIFIESFLKMSFTLPHEEMTISQLEVILNSVKVYPTLREQYRAELSNVRTIYAKKQRERLARKKQ
ncbi:plasmid mobilization protein [Mammaliicoccus sciuri]|nr:hypothetical protein [Mammaliicoccus sciuri]